MNVAIVIPVYQPDARLEALVGNVIDAGIERVIVVNDGSDLEARPIFTRLASSARCVVLDHPTNMGKGRALKSGFRYVLQNLPHIQGVVTADADGQHLPSDVLRLARRLSAQPDCVVLGVRAFVGKVPLRSVIGNRLTQAMFAAVVGRHLSDTQTGLRAFPMALLPALLDVTGDRYDYEMNVLIAAKTLRVPVEEEPIQTVYLEGNRSSHFRPLRDSMSIYSVLVRYVLSSLFASGCDMLLFVLVLAAHPDVPVALVLARLSTSILYLVLKKDVVFRSLRPMQQVVLPYYALVCAGATTSYILMQILPSLGWQDPVVSKLVVDALLFPFIFVIQRDFIFFEQRFPKARWTAPASTSVDNVGSGHAA